MGSVLTGWEEKFLRYYREWGSKAQATRAAGISQSTVYDREQRYPEFARDVKEAKEEFLDHLEEDLVRMGREKNNVIATLARLKADRPDRYCEKLQIAGHLETVSYNIAGPEAEKLLQRMLQNITEPTRRMLVAGKGFVSEEPPPG